ncbi:hypothetical protein BH23GEM9_BH23GEM9_04610 [soil metagenome]
MSRSLNIVAIALAMTFAGACNDEPLKPSADGVAPAAQASVTGSPNDLEAIRQIMANLDDAWGNDPVAYAAQYAHAIDWVSPNGVIINDPAARTALYTFLFTNVFAGTQRTSTIRRLTFFNGTTAVLDIQAGVVGGGGVGAFEKNVLVKRAGEWQILLHQQTLIAP